MVSPQQYISSDSFSFPQPIQAVNMLWDSPDFVAEESLNGYLSIITVEPSLNSIYVSKKRCGPFSLGKMLSGNFSDVRDLPLFSKLGHCRMVSMLVSERKKDLNSLFDVGGLGAEVVLSKFGYKFILIDLLEFSGVDLRQEEWSIRRAYLQDAVTRIASPLIGISEVVSTRKQEFFDTLLGQGSNGTILKDIHGLYRPGVSKNMFEVLTGNIRMPINVTLSKDWGVWDKHSNQSNFDYTHYLAVNALNTPENLKKLQS